MLIAEVSNNYTDDAAQNEAATIGIPGSFRQSSIR